MLDFALTKVALIGVVSLVVLGPERLPRVARTAGALLGRAQRYLADVRTQVAQEIELDDLRRLKAGIETTAVDMQRAINDGVHEQQVQIEKAVHDEVAAVREAVDGGTSGPGLPAVEMEAEAETDPFVNGWPGTRYLAPAPPAPRKNWRVKRAAIPLWYRRSVTGGQYSGRIPPKLRRPTAAAGYARRVL
jgi:sec-independent protein translocase protein TatB